MTQQIKTTAQLLMATAGVQCLVKHAILSFTMRMLKRLVMNNLRMAVQPISRKLSTCLCYPGLSSSSALKLDVKNAFQFNSIS
jgi:hypothetical protein